jgi:hypothetical protein
MDLYSNQLTMEKRTPDLTGMTSCKVEDGNATSKPGVTEIGRRESTGVVPKEFYESRLIIGATNVPDDLEVERLEPGTLIVDDSGPHCFQVPKAIERSMSQQDILFTEGGILQSSTVIPCLRYLPPHAM